MKTKLIFLAPLLLVTACGTTVRDPLVNPRSLNDQELLREKIIRVEQLEREMDKREQDLKMQHLKELYQTQTQNRSSSSAQTVNTNCRFLCF
jgi:hypothetical protein